MLLYKLFFEKIGYFLLGKKLTNKIFITPYKGLSKDIWILALVTLINRSGAMVVPFLSLYLKDSLNFSYSQVGIVMSFYGLGSFFGTWLGGRLTDKLGYYKVMYLSLFIGAVLFFALQYIETYLGFCIGIFVLILVIDLFRPAMWVAISDYSSDENKTRSVTLIRLAINLGFSIGPALAGLIIATLSYKGLFWVDAATTLGAGIVLYIYLYQKSDSKTKEIIKTEKKLSPYKDFQFILFWIAIFLSGVAFIQFIEILPLFYKNIIKLNEEQIGLILALNGFLIFLTEMPIVDYLDKKYHHIKLVIFGMMLFATSFVILNFSHSIWIVILGMVLLTYGEVFSFPFSNTYAMERSKKGNQGAYMAMYGMTYSAAFIIAPIIGMYITDHYGYETLWYVVTGILLLSCVMLIWLKKNIDKEHATK
jgi:predicted MFS family arabinose efflux permease